MACEPAFVRLTLAAPATLRSGAALQSEEGTSQDFLFLLLAAYLERCGVAASALRRFPSLTNAALVAEQFSVTPLSTPPSEEPSEQEERLLRQLPPYRLDVSDMPGMEP